MPVAHAADYFATPSPHSNGESAAHSYSADISNDTMTGDLNSSTNGKSTPEVHINGRRRVSSVRSMSTNGQPGEDGWGSHFWVTLIDPQVRLCGLNVCVCCDLAADPGLILRLPGYWRGQLGPAHW
ncbi:hypothetical protein OBBRIDRAFT_221717 [Obba rivulosa]|uniref:Uncharacterized protein n=1 Tax=Obba rivulosa TaxID=1052685 RepID=A0A8E2ATP5_9APHY|nr:hypothetical protein OBBRIDRAFT_221717 [Obba rivulosa]